MANTLLSERQCFVFLFWKPLQLVILPNLKTLSKTLFPTASGHTILFSFKGILQNTLLPVGKAAGSQGVELRPAASCHSPCPASVTAKAYIWG